MTEQQYIAQQDAKHKNKLKKMLRKVSLLGILTRKESELLSCNNLVYFGGPRDGIQHNCYHLTEKGKAELELLD